MSSVSRDTFERVREGGRRLTNGARNNQETHAEGTKANIRNDDGRDE